MAKCTECGASVADDLKFCGYCGAKLNIVGEHLGTQILRNTQAIMDAVAEMAPLATFKVLGTITEGLLSGGYILARRIDKGASFWWSNGEDLTAVDASHAADAFERGTLAWNSELTETCPLCLTKYHLTRGVCHVQGKQTVFQSSLRDLKQLGTGWIQIGCGGGFLPGLPATSAIYDRPHSRISDPDLHFDKGWVLQLLSVDSGDRERFCALDEFNFVELWCPSCVFVALTSPEFWAARFEWRQKAFDVVAELTEKSIHHLESRMSANKHSQGSRRWRREQADAFQAEMMPLAARREALNKLRGMVKPYHDADAAEARSFAAAHAPDPLAPLSSLALWRDYQRQVMRLAGGSGQHLPWSMRSADDLRGLIERSSGTNESYW